MPFDRFQNLPRRKTRPDVLERNVFLKREVDFGDSHFTRMAELLESTNEQVYPLGWNASSRLSLSQPIKAKGLMMVWLSLG